MAEPKKVFVSYSHDDARRVLPVIDRLRAQGLDVWFDEELTPGVDWSEELARTIEACDVCLFFISNASVQSTVCEREVSLAVRRDRQVLPVYLEEASLPPTLELGIGNLQAIRPGRGAASTIFESIWPTLSGSGPTADATTRAHRPRAVPTAPIAWLILLSLLGTAAYLSWQHVTTGAAGIRVAVLAFENFSGDPGNDYLGTGLAEEILDALANIDALDVVPRTASFYFRDKSVPFDRIAEALDADVVLEGSVLKRDGDNLRIATQLIDAGSSSHLFSKVSAVHINDVLQLKQQIALQVAGTLLGSEEALSPPETENGQAYDFYLQGKEYLSGAITIEQREIARDLFAKAYEIDSGFLGALAGLCKAELDVYVLTRLATDHSRAVSTCTRVAAAEQRTAEAELALAELNRHSGNCDVALAIYRRAVAADPKLEPAYYGLARCQEGLGDYEGAAETFQDGIRIEPRNWQAYFGYAGFLFRRGLYLESAEASRRVLELTPDNAPAYNNLGTALFAANEWEGAAEAWQKALAQNPSLFGHFNVATSLYYQHRFEEARDQLLAGIEAYPDNYRLWGKLGSAYRNLPGAETEAAAAYRKAVELAEPAIEVNPDDTAVLGYLSTCYANLGENDAALTAIQQAIELAPEDPELRYYAAVVGQLSGDPVLVREALQQAAELGYSERQLSADPLLSDAWMSLRAEAEPERPADR